jgi:phosphoribosylglycinamide formyltransferase 1
VSTRVAVFVSGGGSNLQALLDRFESAPDADDWRPRVVLVVSDKPDAGALERAHREDIPTRTIAVQGRPEDDVAAETLAALDGAAIDLVVLAGYLKRVPGRVVARYAERMLNVHPALLPAFGGAGMYGRRVHEAVLAAGCRVSGVTVHFVDEEYDRGPILAQWPVPVLPGDSAERLAARVLRVEHRLLPLCVEELARRLQGVDRGAPPPADASSFTWAGAAAPDEDGLRRGLAV